MKNPYINYGVSDSVFALAQEVLAETGMIFERIEERKEANQLRVLQAFRDARFSESHFSFSSGYGYDDAGRERVEQIYSCVFGGEASYVRIQISSGTQAIAACLFGVLRPGDELLSVTGKPYDTLSSVIGIKGADENSGSLHSFGISYREIPLLIDGEPDTSAIEKSITAKTKMVFIQKSRGYTGRRCLLGEDIDAIVRAVKGVNRRIVVFVDNCYGEFVETSEPCSLGADLCAGSLIKNPGGGLAPAGGYIVGRRELVEAAAAHLTSPGLGSHVGPSLGFTRSIAQGLFFAPHVTAECLKGAVFSAGLFEKSGFAVSPSSTAERGDIVQSVTFQNGEQVTDFCRIVQSCSPVDSFVVPQPWAMPGYDAPVVMAAGAFTQGSSLELSADGPIKPPYQAYMQGGLVFEQVKLAAMRVVEKMGNSI